ncbi:hypothetical protein VDG1235_3088 [Verrucomicrobiia bacterium DG1235]|nr:hypothetical protein VDG1235_3088 [Verrucomicrobiae bacterium DG1235]
MILWSCCLYAVGVCFFGFFIKLIARETSQPFLFGVKSIG